MNNSYVDKLKAMIADSTETTPEKISDFLNDTIAYIRKVQTIGTTGDLEQRKKAFLEAIEAKELIQKLSSKKKTG